MWRMVSLGVASLNLLLHLMVGVFIVLQLRWPFPFGAWTRAWGALLVAWACILVFRVDDFAQPPLSWRMVLGCPMTLALWYGMAQLARIFRQPLAPPPPPP
jgi:hypothetical protein